MNKDKIKKEWNKQVEITQDIGLALVADSVSDWWLAKLEEAIQQNNEMLIKEIKKLPLPNEYDKQTADDLIDYIINLINNLK